MKLYQTTDYQRVARMDSICFDGDYPVTDWDQCTWWIGIEKGTDACYCAIKEINGFFYLNRAGVMPDFRGRGYQRKMLDKRLKFAGDRVVITDTVASNTASNNNLIRAGFLMFHPQTPWKTEHPACIYWRREGK